MLGAGAKNSSFFVDCTITSDTKGHTKNSGRLQNSIGGCNPRLELRKKPLTRQFTAMETALSNLSSQSTWLAGQISSLPSSSSS